MDPQLLMNLLTGGLAIATVWLAIETRRMASASKSQIELQGQPHLAFHGFNIATAQVANIAEASTTQALRLGLELNNPGHVLVNYEVTSLSSSLGSVSLNSSDFATKGGVVHPGTQTLFLLPFALIPPGPSGPAPSSEVEFAISYWATTESKQSLKAKVRLQLLSLQPLNFQWVFLDGPTYA